MHAIMTSLRFDPQITGAEIDLVHSDVRRTRGAVFRRYEDLAPAITDEKAARLLSAVGCWPGAQREITAAVRL